MEQMCVRALPGPRCSHSDVLVAAVTAVFCFCGGSRALIERNWAWLELGVRVFGWRVGVLSVRDPPRANISLLSGCA